MPGKPTALAEAEAAFNAGKFDHARLILQRALQRDGTNAELNHAMAVTFEALKQPDQALYYAARTLRLEPESVEAAARVAGLARRLDKLDALRTMLEKDVESTPRSVSSRLALASFLETRDRYSAAADVCLEGVRREPGSLPLLKRCLADLGKAARIEETAALSREVLARAPDQDNAATCLAYALNYVDPPDKPGILEAHRHVARIIDRMVVRRPGAFQNSRDSGRPVKVGLLSPDLREHSVAYFVEAILRHRDRSAIEVHCYSTTDKFDAVSERFRSLADGWHAVGDLDDPALAARTRSDRVDVLLELSGHTDGNRLPVFMHDPAPVTATYIGYPNTTGMAQIHHRLVDSRTDPVGEDRWSTEKLVRLDPCFLCYTPPASAPPAVPPPCDAPGAVGVTFGSFNTLVKLSDATVEAWSRVLSGLPGSGLVLKAPQMFDPDVRERTLRRFEQRGIARDRVRILQKTMGMDEHLNQYGLVDIALDPFPYAGTTTTCEALWMGVPVVTVGGETHASRVGVSLLSAAGLTELIAPDRDGYVGTACGLAADRPRLRELRRTLRDRVGRSALCDGPAFARRFEAAVRGVWAEWCARA